ncbi:molybdopterin synthase [Halobaculum sp. P14]|uniref:molybdopterin synthase n=1 Tax=Halobaculum sp. P14 TaxID=3421638 RepID=UPI003EBEA942
MQTLSIVGSGADGVADAIAERLDGRVATVRRTETADAVGDDPDTERPQAAAPGGVDAAVDLAPDGDWAASGVDGSFTDALDRLAPAHDYCLVSGFSRLRLPTVVVGDAEVPGDVVRRVDDAADLDPAALAAEIDDVEPYVTLEELVARVKRSEQADRAGAIATFTGRVRAKDAPDDDRTTHLAFEKYEGVAADRLGRIERELADRDGVLDVRLHHRVGVIEDGEDIVFVVVLAGHRREAFRAVEDGIDRLKDEVPIFKKETTESEEFWVHDRA